MANTDTRNLPSFFNTDADFQSYCQGIAAQLVVAGMVKTADTGQINNATVTKPGLGNTSQGYEIYKFSDALQTTVPIFFKIEYGSGANADRPALWLTVATGSNGTGTLTGPTGTRTQFGTSNSKVAGGVLPSYCCGDGSRFALATNYDVTSNAFGFFLSIDRLRDGGGSATSDGFTQVAWASNGNKQVSSCIGNSMVTNTGAVLVSLTPASGGPPVGAGVRSFNNNIACMPVIILAGQIRYLSSFVIYRASDITGAAPTTFSVTNFGASHTMLPLPSIINPGSTAMLGQSDDIALLWE